MFFTRLHVSNYIYMRCPLRPQVAQTCLISQSNVVAQTTFQIVCLYPTFILGDFFVFSDSFELHDRKQSTLNNMFVNLNIPVGCVPSVSDRSHQMSALGGCTLYSGVPCRGGLYSEVPCPGGPHSSGGGG